MTAQPSGLMIEPGSWAWHVPSHRLVWVIHLRRKGSGFEAEVLLPNGEILECAEGDLDSNPEAGPAVCVRQALDSWRGSKTDS